MTSGGTIAVGVCYVDGALHEGSSLKDKRRVLRSLTDRARAKFNVSVAEVDHQDLWCRFGLAFSHVSNSGAFSTEALSCVVNWLESQGEFDIVDYSIQVL